MPRAGAGLDHPELELPEVRSLWQTEGLFSDHYLKARIRFELLVEHWSSLVNGASVDSRLKRSRKLKGPQNYFELVGQFEALISSD